MLALFVNSVNDEHRVFRMLSDTFHDLVQSLINKIMNSYDLLFLCLQFPHNSEPPITYIKCSMIKKLNK